MSGAAKSLYDTYFIQYCFRNSLDPFLKFLELSKSVHNPSILIPELKPGFSFLNKKKK